MIFLQCFFRKLFGDFIKSISIHSICFDQRKKKKQRFYNVGKNAEYGESKILLRGWLKCFANWQIDQGAVEVKYIDAQICKPLLTALFKLVTGLK